MEKFIEVNYVCECGNKQSANPDSSGSTRMVYRYAVPIDKNIRMICLKCGKDMKLEITKTTHKLETEIIEG